MFICCIVAVVVVVEVHVGQQTLQSKGAAWSLLSDMTKQQNIID